uniref:Cytochrome b-c1 complex subunit 9 n=1 Tax=Corvus moneduloides TaxID=1196302 RepID=A0A8C3H2E3_CORMO
MPHGAPSTVYGSLFRRTSTFALSVVLGAVLFERAFDQGADALFERLNEGVRAPGPLAVPKARLDGDSGRCPWPWEWHWMSFKVPSHPNHSMVL